MSRRLSFYAIARDAVIPNEIKRVLNDKLDIQNIFGTKCYVMLEDEDKSPLNLLDEECHRKVERWLATVRTKSVFRYSWG